MIRLTGTVEGVAQLDRALGMIVAAAEDFSTAFEALGDEFLLIEQEQFLAEGYGDWPALKPSYLARKQRLYGNQTILRATDRLFESLTIRGAADNVWRIEQQQAEFGTSTPYAIWHQRGTGFMPARPVISLREQDNRRLMRVVQRHLIATGQAAGFQVTATNQ
jgi:phage gpG-like protein